MSDITEKREFTRVPIRLKVDLYAGDTRIHCDETRDVSLKGVYLRTAQRLPLGTDCRIAVSLGGPNTDLRIEMDAQIVRVDSAGMAVEFTAIGIDSFYHLRNLCTYSYGDVECMERELHEQLTRHDRRI